MNKFLITFFTLLLSILNTTYANNIINPGFEDKWNGWKKVDKKKNALGISSDAKSGEHSAKITKKTGYFAQAVAVEPNTNYELSAYIYRYGVLAVKVGSDVFFERIQKAKDWKKVSVKFNSKDASHITIFAQYNGKKGLFDDFNLVTFEGEAHQGQGLKIGYKGLSPSRSPGENFELTDWNLSLPFDEDDNSKADNISEKRLSEGYQRKPYFYTAEDGGMVFYAPNYGPKTSKNTKYTRSELREMLRRGDSSIKITGVSKNNWVFSSAPSWSQKNSGGVDGTLTATLAVNHVSTTGEPKKIGRVIIGQIHAKDDEPVRIYYRKLPHHKKGSIYVAHEPIEGYGKEQWSIVVGSKKSNANEPENGIALNEKFSYSIITKGYSLIVVFLKENGAEFGRAEFDMTKSGYDQKEDYMYFKAGVYNQNNSGDKDDYVQATFYKVENTHKGYKH